jgi:hypothetical protein
MSTTGFLNMPRNHATVLKNLTCVYCGNNLTKQTQTKEHVIGRRFVPKGTLNQEWNLILFACQPCNVRKSGLEDDISAITMHADARGRSPSAMAEVEANRKKTKSRSQRTGRPVGESSESVELQVPVELMSSISIDRHQVPGELKGSTTIGLTGPPQIESKRAYELARLQIMGFFYFLTFNENSFRGGYWPGTFLPIIEAYRADWGNLKHRAFMTVVLNWEPRIVVTTAQDHYQIAIRKHPTASLWSWAVEWNKNYRVVGFFGDTELALRVASNLPSLDMTPITKESGRSLRYRLETTLNVEDDVLFNWPEQSQT